MKKIKNVLVETHTGAIAIALLIASAIQTLLGILVYPIQNAFIRQPEYSFAVPSRTSYDPAVLIFGVLGGLLSLIVAYCLMRWLYMSPQETIALPREDSEQLAD